MVKFSIYVNRCVFEMGLGVQKSYPGGTKVAFCNNATQFVIMPHFVIMPQFVINLQSDVNLRYNQSGNRTLSSSVP